MDANINILMRYSDNLFGVGEVIRAHQKVIDETGFVWMGKFGQPLGQKRLEAIHAQIERGAPTSLFLGMSGASRNTTFEGIIQDICFDLEDSETNAIPTYYRDKGLLGNVAFWMKLSSIDERDPELLDRLYVVSSRSTARFALEKSMNGIFIVSRDRVPSITPKMAT